MSEPSAPSAEYRCPGEGYAISRAVHLGRLVRFYPACLRCPHRDDQALLSPRQRRQLGEVARRADRPPLFGPEGVTAVSWNELNPTQARQIARAMGLWLRQQRGDACPPTALVAGDGRPGSAELLFALVEGLRWAGCATVETPAATAATTAWAIHHLACDGGLLLGNPTGKAHTVGLKFWGPEGRPLSSPGDLETISQLCETDLDRPVRRFGARRCVPVDVPYLARLADEYHGLRPLRLVVRSECPPLVRQFEMLLAATACRCMAFEPEAASLPEQIRQQEAHFGVHVGDDGEQCLVYDEQGRPVSPERLAALVRWEQQVPELTPPPLPCRGQTHAWLQQHAAEFAADAGGRFWYRLEPNCWAADALRTLTLLLRHLSRSDRPLSAVLDALPAMG